LLLGERSGKKSRKKGSANEIDASLFFASRDEARKIKERSINSPRNLNLVLDDQISSLLRPRNSALNSLPSESDLLSRLSSSLDLDLDLSFQRRDDDLSSEHSDVDWDSSGVVERGSLTTEVL